MKILVVEDEKDVRDLMVLTLAREGHQAAGLENGEEALRLLSKTGYDLVVLDWMLPGVSGLDICKSIRKMEGSPSRVPILMVTARAETTDIVLGLEMGADDYVTKPFEVAVFAARARALLRRAQTASDGGGDFLQVGEVKLDIEAHRAYLGKNEIELTNYEFKLLHALMANRGRALSRDRLMRLVQGEGVEVVDRTIDTHVFGLRKKLGGSGEMIETIRGVGYRIGN